MGKFISYICSKSHIAKIILLVVLYFGINLYLSFATDTYATFSTGFRGAGWDMAMRNGRPIIGAIYILYSLSGLSNESFYYISSVLALVFLTMSVWIYQEILKKYVANENIRILLSFAAIANIFIIEYFMFIEKCGFMLAVLFNVIGVYWVEKFFDTHQWKHYFFSIIAMVLATFTYQGTIALFVMLSVPFAIRSAENLKCYVLNGITIGIVYILPVLFNLLAFRFAFKNTRITDTTNYVLQLKAVMEGAYYNGKFTFNILPPNVFLIATLTVFFSAIAWNMMHEKYLRIFNVFVIVLAACIFPTASITQGSGWWAARVVYPMASLTAVLAIDLFVDYKETIKARLAKKFICCIALAAVFLTLFCQYFAFNKIYIDKYRLNALDEYRYQYIYQAICDYNEATGIDIKKIAFYSDAERSYKQYANLYNSGDLIVSAFLTDWSDISAMNYYLQKDYEKVAPYEKYIEYFSKKNWNCLSQEQLIFEGDTLHICVY